MMQNSLLQVQGAQDAGIPGIARALNARSMAGVLGEIASKEPGVPCNPGELAITLLRLKRDRRCLLRYDFFNSATGEGIEPSFIGKMRARGVDRKTFQLNQMLWNGAFGANASDGIHVPEPVALLSDPDMYLLRNVNAATLAAELESADGERFCYRAGEALYKLHTQGPTPTRSHTLNDEYRILSEKLQATCEELPTLAPRIRRILSACEVLLNGIRDADVVSLHRDFYPEQLLVDAERVWLLDLDLYASGDPMVDVGNFIAHLHELSLRIYRHSYAYVSHEHAFRDGYQSHSGSRCSISASAYVTLTLARHIAISRLFPERMHSTVAVITQCERRLALQVESFSEKSGVSLNQNRKGANHVT